jgi:hypothetical protein
VATTAVSSAKVAVKESGEVGMSAKYINKFLFINHEWFKMYISKNVTAFNKIHISVQAHFLHMLLLLRQ